MHASPWYAGGLRFECTQCGNCCTGTPGFVWVTHEELVALASAIGEEPEAFADKYVRKVGLRSSLREFPNGDCVFFDTDTRRCTVYEVRPRQCRTWPFWDSNLRRAEDWEKTCGVCPGSGQGPLYQLGDIDAQRGIMRV
jgi:uncharacterized protein